MEREKGSGKGSITWGVRGNGEMSRWGRGGSGSGMVNPLSRPAQVRILEAIIGQRGPAHGSTRDPGYQLTQTNTRVGTSKGREATSAGRVGAVVGRLCDAGRTVPVLVGG